MIGILIKNSNGWAVHTLGDDVNHASVIFKLHPSTVLSQETLRAWISNQTKTTVTFELLDGMAFIPNQEDVDANPFSDGTSKHEVFAIKKGEAYLGYKTKNNNFHFKQLPYTEPVNEQTDRLAQLKLFSWLEKMDYLSDSATSIWEEFIKTR